MFNSIQVQNVHTDGVMFTACHAASVGWIAPSSGCITLMILCKEFLFRHVGNVSQKSLSLYERM